MSRVTLPGLVDVHVHLRVPGGEEKETADTGTAAALAGGFTAVLAMPNTTPPVTSAALLDDARGLLAAGARCDVGQYLGATADNAAAAAAAADRACGLKIYADTTFGPLHLASLADMAAHVQSWPRCRPLVFHAEGVTVAQAVGLAAAHRRWVHVAHVSRRDEIELIVAAKEAGVPVTCEVTPHHLLLTAADAAALGPRAAVRPPLATAEDRAALWQHLDAVDCLATDHAPHIRAEKEAPDPPPGFPGLETALPLMLTAVAEQRLTLDRLVTLASAAPARLFGVSTPAESAVDVDLDSRWTLPESGYATKADWSPFAGTSVRGRVMEVRLRGTTAWSGGEARQPPGSGRLLPAPSTRRQGVGVAQHRRHDP
ncbi:MAG: amidohydrolase family protein [Anaerolineae bacterium]